VLSGILINSVVYYWFDKTKAKRSIPETAWEHGRKYMKNIATNINK
jgi:hypothetical protein